MFGILRPSIDLLDANERAHFSRTYCNLCATLGLQYGIKARMLLVHDICTIGWLHGAISDLPFRTANCLQGGVPKTRGTDVTPSLAFMAAMSTYAIGVKVSDDAEDGDGWRSTIGQSLYGDAIAHSSLDLQSLGFDVAAIEEQLRRQRQLELKGEQDLSAISQPTGTVYGLVVEQAAALSTAQMPLDVARKAGHILGRCVYLYDALRDYRRDWGHAFNPLHENGSKGRSPTSAIRRRVQSFIAECLEELSSLILSLPEAIQRRWAAVAGRLAALFQISPASVTLYVMCCIPCGDGAVIADDKDCSGCMSVAGFALCCCLCCNAARGC